MDTGGYLAVATLVTVASLLWQLNVDFYRPWCERRVREKRAARREHDLWIESLARMNEEFRASVIPAMRRLRESAVSASEATANLAAAVRRINADANE